MLSYSNLNLMTTLRDKILGCSISWFEVETGCRRVTSLRSVHLPGITTTVIFAFLSWRPSGSAFETQVVRENRQLIYEKIFSKIGPTPVPRGYSIISNFVGSFYLFILVFSFFFSRLDMLIARFSPISFGQNTISVVYHCSIILRCTTPKNQISGKYWSFLTYGVESKSWGIPISHLFILDLKFKEHWWVHFGNNFQIFRHHIHNHAYCQSFWRRRPLKYSKLLLLEIFTFLKRNRHATMTCRNYLTLWIQIVLFDVIFNFLWLFSWMTSWRIRKTILLRGTLLEYLFSRTLLYYY